eukprot:5828094-Alexandrium_andersonii.AAC.1
MGPQTPTAPTAHVAGRAACTQHTPLGGQHATRSSNHPYIRKKQPNTAKHVYTHTHGSKPREILAH